MSIPRGGADVLKKRETVGRRGHSPVNCTKHVLLTNRENKGPKEKRVILASLEPW